MKSNRPTHIINGTIYPYSGVGYYYYFFNVSLRLSCVFSLSNAFFWTAFTAAVVTTYHVQQRSFTCTFYLNSSRMRVRLIPVSLCHVRNFYSNPEILVFIFVLFARFNVSVDVFCFKEIEPSVSNESQWEKFLKPLNRLINARGNPKSIVIFLVSPSLYAHDHQSTDSDLTANAIQMLNDNLRIRFVSVAHV